MSFGVGGGRGRRGSCFVGIEHQRVTIIARAEPPQNSEVSAAGFLNHLSINILQVRPALTPDKTLVDITVVKTVEILRNTTTFRGRSAAVGVGAALVLEALNINELR